MASFCHRFRISTFCVWTARSSGRVHKVFFVHHKVVLVSPSVIAVDSYAGHLRSLWFQAGSDAKSRTPRRRSTCLSLHKSIGLHACFTSVFNSWNLPCILQWFEKQTHQLGTSFLPVEVTNIREYLYSVLPRSLPRLQLVQRVQWARLLPVKNFHTPLLWDIVFLRHCPASIYTLTA